MVLFQHISDLFRHAFVFVRKRLAHPALAAAHTSAVQKLAPQKCSGYNGQCAKPTRPKSFAMTLVLSALILSIEITSIKGCAIPASEKEKSRLLRRLDPLSNIPAQEYLFP